MDVCAASRWRCPVIADREGLWITGGFAADNFQSPFTPAGFFCPKLNETIFATLFATQRNGTGRDQATRPNLSELIIGSFFRREGINWNGRARTDANCKTVYTSSILVVASSNNFNGLRQLFHRPRGCVFRYWGSKGDPKKRDCLDRSSLVGYRPYDL